MQTDTKLEAKKVNRKIISVPNDSENKPHDWFGREGGGEAATGALAREHRGGGSSVKGAGGFETQSPLQILLQQRAALRNSNSDAKHPRASDEKVERAVLKRALFLESLTRGESAVKAAQADVGRHEKGDGADVHRTFPTGNGGEGGDGGGGQESGGDVLDEINQASHMQDALDALSGAIQSAHPDFYVHTLPSAFSPPLPSPCTSCDTPTLLQQFSPAASESSPVITAEFCTVACPSTLFAGFSPEVSPQLPSLTLQECSPPPPPPPSMPILAAVTDQSDDNSLSQQPLQRPDISSVSFPTRSPRSPLSSDAPPSPKPILSKHVSTPLPPRGVRQKLGIELAMVAGVEGEDLQVVVTELEKGSVLSTGETSRIICFALLSDSDLL